MMMRHADPVLLLLFRYAQGAPKDAKDKVKSPKGPPARCQSLEGPWTSSQALAGSRFSIPGFSWTGFCQIPGSQDFCQFCNFGYFLRKSVPRGPKHSDKQSRDFSFKNPGIWADLKSRDPGISGIPPGPASSAKIFLAFSWRCPLILSLLSYGHMIV